MDTSEIAKKQHSANVWRIRCETMARRERISAEFKRDLLTELGTTELTASQRALLIAAVSSYTEMVEISERFKRLHATPRAIRELAVCRSELRRCLEGLRLINAVDRDDAPQTPEALMAMVAADNA